MKNISVNWVKIPLKNVTQLSRVNCIRKLQMQNLQKYIRTSAELTKVYSDKCRTYKSRFGQMQNLQKSMRVMQKLQKVHSDKRQLDNSDKGRLNNLDKCSSSIQM